MSKVRLYYQNNITANTISLLSKKHAHYIVNVMRLKRGSNINFFNKSGEWISEIVFLENDRVEVKFLKKIKSSSKISDIQLAICLVKKNPMETILQKATELGVCKIIPIISEHTEVRELNLDRANKIIIEKSGFDEVMTVDDGALAGSSSDYNTIKDNIQYKSSNR